MATESLGNPQLDQARAAALAAAQGDRTRLADDPEIPPATIADLFRWVKIAVYQPLSAMITGKTRVATAPIPAIAAGLTSSATVVVTWPSAFADTAYVVSITPTKTGLIGWEITGQAADKLTLKVLNLSAVQALAGNTLTLHVTATHA